MILLDTHVAVWALMAVERIGSRSRRDLAGGGPVYYSVVTLVEVSIKRMLGRRDLPGDLHTMFREVGLESLPLRDEHVLELERCPELSRHDPFDRLLVAQAAAEGCRLVTADRRLLALGHEWIEDATV
jgi:PIN domain nuclease of toxin-antitoxin system